MPQRHAARGNGKLHANPAEPALSPEGSAELRDRLLRELSNLDSSDDAALWAHRCLPEKNRLTAADARRVEEGFQVRLASFATAPSAQSQTAGTARQLRAPPSPQPSEPRKRSRAKGVDKAALSLPEPRRIRDRDHVRYVATKACLVCGRRPCDAHHLRFVQSRALGRMVSDEFVVPLCRGHHRELHRHGDESAWWRKVGIGPTAAARALWLETHPLSTASEGLSDIADSPTSNSTV